MSVDNKPSRIHDGLSPSSLSLFTSCARKYFFKKVARIPIDSDASEDSEPFRVGKAFHKCLEDTRHVLDGFTYQMAKDTVCGEFELTEFSHLPMIFAMLAKYKEVHHKAGLTAVAFEKIIDTPEFYGIVDVILDDPDGGWWIGDMKTAASYSQQLLPSLPRHPQLNLYAYHAGVLAETLGLDVEKFKGCRYRLTTKSRLTRKKDESVTSFLARLEKSIDSYDFVIPKSIMRPELVAATHAAAKSFVSGCVDEAGYAPNYGSCMNYFRPCEFWSQCHGQVFTNMMNIETIASD